MPIKGFIFCYKMFIKRRNLFQFADKFPSRARKRKAAKMDTNMIADEDLKVNSTYSEEEDELEMSFVLPSSNTPENVICSTI